MNIISNSDIKSAYKNNVGAERATARAPQPLGLSSAHISPGEFTIYPNGHLMTVGIPHPENIRVGGGKRGRATFSKASRRRLLHKCAKTDKRCVPLLVTLTYPKEFPIDAEIWKKHLDNFAKRFFRKYPNAGLAWKLEPQQRGAPHFHLLVWNVPFAWLYAFTARNWYEVVGSGDEKHLRAGTRVEIARTSKGAKTYFAKYIGKSNNEFQREVGRYWGFRGQVPWSDLFSIQSNYPVAIQMMRYQKRFMMRTVKIIKDEKGKVIKIIKKPIKGKSYQSLTCMVEDPMKWALLWQYTFDSLKPQITLE